jgi:nucleotide-binding universal stress UspA family protein
MTEQRKKIMVPVDFEGAARRALSTARWLAGPLGAELVLLHVHTRADFEHPELPAETVERIQGLVEEEAQKSLAALVAETGANEGLFRHGDPAEQILEAARQIHPVLVVMGTHGRHGLNRVLHGSVADAVLRACPVPLITVREAPT